VKEQPEKIKIVPLKSKYCFKCEDIEAYCKCANPALEQCYEMVEHKVIIFESELDDGFLIVEDFAKE
jgi:hypothetical protein